MIMSSIDVKTNDNAESTTTTTNQAAKNNTFRDSETKKKRAYPMQRAPALCGVWGRVLVASLILACAMRGDHGSNPGPSGHRR